MPHVCTACGQWRWWKRIPGCANWRCKDFSHVAWEYERDNFVPGGKRELKRRKERTAIHLAPVKERKAITLVPGKERGSRRFAAEVRVGPLL